jgi:membrane protein DedA with SNARE-associated domain
MLTDAVNFIAGHAGWAAPIAFALAFFKSLAFVSLVVPSWTLFSAVGAMVAASHIPLVPIWVAMSLGAALGDWVSYWLGYRFKDQVRRIWPFPQHPELLPRGERFFRRWGALSVVLCRFFSPLRATVPLLCGIFEMPSWKFQLANWPSAFLWAAAVLFLGQAAAEAVSFLYGSFGGAE